MKLQIYFRPGLVVLLMVLTAALLCWATRTGGWPAWLALPFAAFFTVLALLSAWAWLRSLMLERSIGWAKPERLLILAPHEDDCVISAGAIGAINRKLGGATRILYLAPDEAPGMAEIRAAEARAAWQLADVGDGDIRHLDLLPRLTQRDPQRLRGAAAVLRREIDDFAPTVVVTPMFEGGHIHHDMTVGLLDQIVTERDTFEVFEAPEYSPLASLRHTPHRLLALTARWLLGLVAYYGPPDGIDGRPVVKVRLRAEELDLKRRMLACFTSQNAPSLVATRGYPDRLVRWQREPDRRSAFQLQGSFLGFVLAARRLLPARLVDRLLPVQLGTIGREGRIADWQEEWRL